MTDTTETAAIWATIKALWVSGRFSTFGALHRKSVEQFADQCPTLQAIRRRADRELWANDGALSEQMEEETRKTAVEILNELGMGLTRRLELLSEIIIAPHEDHDRIKAILDKLFTGSGEEIDQKTIAAALKDLRTLYAQGMKVSLQALALAGQYAGDISGKATGSGSEGGSGKDVSNMTEEERQVEIERMLRSLNMRLVPDAPEVNKSDITL